MLFDQRVRTLHDFGASPHNFISFNPQGRLVALAGFGNLAGKIDIFDRRSLTKVCTIDAPNTSFCEWSPDGRFLLTATLSPRLRVDNGIKIWHCSGPLLHLQAIEELYQASWRPTPIEGVPQFTQVVPAAPEASESVRNSKEAVVAMSPSKPAGAYRPPGARGLATPAIFKREDEGGAPRLPTNGAATPPRGYSRSPVPGPHGPNGNGHQQNGGRRYVPGAAKSPSPVPEGEKKGNRKRKTGSRREGLLPLGVEDDDPEPGVVVVVVVEEEEEQQEAETAVAVVDGALDAIAKKVRNLNKKVGAVVWFPPLF